MQIHFTFTIVGPVLKAQNRALAETFRLSISNPEEMEIRVTGVNNSIPDDDGFSDTVKLSDLPQLLSNYSQGIQAGIDPRYYLREGGKITPRKGDPLVAIAALYSSKLTQTE
jgi:hypothetical protein